MVKQLAGGLALIVCMFAAQAAVGYDTVGPTYSIDEPDMLEVIQARLRRLQDSGQLAQMQRQWADRIREGMTSPPPVAGLSVAMRRRSWTYDPSVVANYDITDAQGRVITAKGTRVNPLDAVAWTSWLFFDGRTPEQVEAAQRWARRQGLTAFRLVAVGGSWASLSRQLGLPVYYDQGGALTRRFAIRSVPAEVVQDGRVLRITELPEAVN